MSSPYVGEIRMFAGNFAPNGWMLCEGQLLPISENETLFNLIGTSYGGDGQSTFALPNLQSRVPVHVGTGGGATYQLGEQGGVESVTLTTNQIPIHSHVATCTDAAGNQATPAGGRWAASSDTAVNPYATAAPDSSFNAQAISSTGGSQPHDNMLPFLCVNFIISLFGIFPSQN
jgi:microcystin-dependent protein